MHILKKCTVQEANSGVKWFRLPKTELFFVSSLDATYIGLEQVPDGMILLLTAESACLYAYRTLRLKNCKRNIHMLHAVPQTYAWLGQGTPHHTYGRS
jgi:hypothetical protein